MSLSYPSRFDISIHAPARGATSFLLYSTPVEIFQSTLPQGERQRKSVHFIPNLINISIHAPARGATPFCFPYQRTVIQFQSTLPQGERPRLLQKTGSDWYFNPRSRKGSDHSRRLRSSHKQRFQSTLPQGERLDESAEGSPLYQDISIHAPARGATMWYNGGDNKNGISIHAPARGATRWKAYRIAKKKNFNPRSRKGSDVFEKCGDKLISISIHAPARGATRSGKETAA